LIFLFGWWDCIVPVVTHAYTNTHALYAQRKTWISCYKDILTKCIIPVRKYWILTGFRRLHAWWANYFISLIGSIFAGSVWNRWRFKICILYGCCTEGGKHGPHVYRWYDNIRCVNGHEWLQVHVITTLACIQQGLIYYRLGVKTRNSVIFARWQYCY